MPSADRLSVSFIMGERADVSSVGSGRMDSPLSAIHHHHLSSTNNQPHYLDIGNNTNKIIINPDVLSYNSENDLKIFTDDDYYDDDEYSIAASSILQQQRRSGGGITAGGGRSSLNRKSRSFRRGRRPSSPFPGDELSMGGRRRTSRGFSVATISSAE